MSQNYHGIKSFFVDSPIASTNPYQAARRRPCREHSCPPGHLSAPLRFRWSYTKCVPTVPTVSDLHDTRQKLLSFLSKLFHGNERPAKLAGSLVG